MLLKLGPKSVAVLLEQPRRAEEIPRELQHLLRRHRRRQHRVAPVARPGGTRLRHPLRHRGVVQWAFACHQQGRRRARGRGRRLSLLAVCLGLRRHCCLVVGALPGSAASASFGAGFFSIAHCGRICGSNALDPRQSSPGWPINARVDPVSRPVIPSDAVGEFSFVTHCFV